MVLEKVKEYSEKAEAASQKSEVIFEKKLKN